MGWIYLLVPLVEGLLCFSGLLEPSRDNIRFFDILYFVILIVHAGAGIFLILRRKRERGMLQCLYSLPECLFVISLLFFLFSYIYALNANMDYVQRFIASGGAVRLALDTTQERLIAAVKFLPLILLNGFYYIFWRLRKAGAPATVWSLPLVLLSVMLSVLSFPSFFSLEGIPTLAFIALVPLFLVLEYVPFRRGLFYITSYGVLQGMLINSWLGTYSLITLQLVSVYFLIFYGLFFIPVLILHRRIRYLRWLVFPVAWVFFEYIRSLGFLGYPWGFWGTTQYRFYSLLQLASITGIWGVSFIVLLLNAGISCTLSRLFELYRGFSENRSLTAWQVWMPLVASSGIMLLVVLGGAINLAARSRLPVTHTARVALIQQNSDPRKHNYRETFESLVSLTDRAMIENPDIVIWSETAFVPNIRRWSQVDPTRNVLAALVRDFLDYQKSLNTWLLTGNDDYEITRGRKGEEVRLNYNAAVLFSPGGRRVETYRKIRLVPFTEHFPWKESLPRVYELLKRFDVHLWEPGRERTVFRHPQFSFAVPICFEDSFPNDIRAFIREGAEAIVNISNDYWSLSEVEAKQHALNSVFRAVENRTPLVRATASGLTCYVDTEGRIRKQAPYFEEAYLVVDVEFKKKTVTLYTRFGDWFPQAMGLILIPAFIVSLPWSRKK